MVTSEQSVRDAPLPQLTMQSWELPFPAIASFLMERLPAPTVVEQLWITWSLAELVATSWEGTDNWALRALATQFRTWEQELRVLLLAHTGHENVTAEAATDSAD